MLNRGFSLSKRIKTIDIAKVFTCLAMATTVSLIPAYGQQIITDGNTNTTLNVNGNVTGVYTNTIKGQNAFNSFERFNVNKGNVVNLYVPDKTNNLINLVNSETSYIDGLLNSIKSGKVGGNIFIANPYGVVVGSDGTINVGSLTVTTPTADYINSFFNSPGKPNQPAVNALLNGTAPINPDGVINIEGKINAIENVTLDTGNFYNSGDIYSGAVFQENDINIGDVVNINTLESGAEIAVNNGQISIKASNNIVNSGNIIADGGNNIDGGSVSAVAGNNVVLERGSLISAKGKGENSNGGYIYTWGDNGNYFNDGATLDARPGETSGAGGFIEVSTRGGLTFKGEVFTGRYNRRGSLLIDPKNITISSSAGSTIADNDQFNENSSSSVIINNSDLVNLLDNPNNVILQANNDITVSNDIIVNNPSGDGGDLTLQAGRSVYINADITTDNGDFTIIANETTANGVVDAQRDSGNGVITMANDTSIDTGSGNVSLSITNDTGKTYNGTGNITLKTIDANNITIDNDGPNTSSGVILNSNDTITAAGNLTIYSNASIIDGTDDSGATLIGNNISLTALYGIGSSTSNYLEIDSGNSSCDVIYARASDSTYGKIYISETNDNLNLNYVWAGNDIALKADDNIIDSRVSGTGNVFGKNITLTSTNGNIGESSSDPLKIELNYQTTGGVLLATATNSTNGNIYIENTDTAAANKALELNYAWAKNDVYLKADDNIIDSRVSGTGNVFGKNITLTSTNGNIGESSSDRLLIDTNYQTSGGELTASASGDIYLKETSGDLNIEYVYSNGNDVYITAAANILDTRGNTDNSYPNIWGNNINLTSTSGTIGASGADNDLDLYINYNSSGGELTASASGDIYLDETQGTLNIEYVFSNGNDVYITSAGSILDANNDDNANIIGDTISLTSTGGDIGASDNYFDIESDSDNDRSNGTLTAAATSGDIFIYEVGDGGTTASKEALFIDSVTAQDEVYLRADYELENHVGPISTSANDSKITLVTDNTQLYDDGSGESISTGTGGIVVLGRANSGDIYAGCANSLEDTPNSVVGSPTHITENEIGTISSDFITLDPASGSSGYWGTATGQNIIIDDNYDFETYNPIAQKVYILRETAGDLSLGYLTDAVGVITQDEINCISADEIYFGNVLDSSIWTYGDTQNISLYDPDFSETSLSSGASSVTLKASNDILDGTNTDDDPSDDTPSHDLGIEAYNLTLEADSDDSGAGAIGASGDSDVDIYITGELNAEAYEDIYIHQANRLEEDNILYLDTVESSAGNTNLYVGLIDMIDPSQYYETYQNIIVDNNSSNNNLIAYNNINVQSYYPHLYNSVTRRYNGDIGSSEDLIEINSATSNTGYFTATSYNTYVEETAGDLNIDKITGHTNNKSVTEVYLKASGAGANIIDYNNLRSSITNANIIANGIVTLEAPNGSIGSGSLEAITAFNLYGTIYLNATAGEDATINIDHDCMAVNNNPIRIDVITTTGDSTVNLYSKYGDIYDFESTTTDTDTVIDITAHDINIDTYFYQDQYNFDRNNSVGISDRLEVELLGTGGELYIRAGQRIRVASNGDMNVEELKLMTDSASSSFDVWTLNSGNLLNTRTDGNPNITTAYSTPTVRIDSAGTIGASDKDFEINIDTGSADYLETVSLGTTYLNNQKTTGQLIIKNSESGGDYNLSSGNSVVLSATTQAAIDATGDVTISSDGSILDNEDDDTTGTTTNIIGVDITLSDGDGNGGTDTIGDDGYNIEVEASGTVTCNDDSCSTGQEEYIDEQ